jgi:hypothetical protein
MEPKRLENVVEPKRLENVVEPECLFAEIDTFAQTAPLTSRVVKRYKEISAQIEYILDNEVESQIIPKVFELLREFMVVWALYDIIELGDRQWIEDARELIDLIKRVDL